MKGTMKIKIFAFAAALASLAGVSAAQEAGSPAPLPPSAPAEREGRLPENFKARILKDFDRDGDGYLNASELAAAKEFLAQRQAKFEQMQRRHAEKIMEEFDSNSDGRLDLEELIPLLEKQRRMFMEAIADMQTPDGRKRMQEIMRGPRDGRRDGRRPEAGPGGDRPNPGRGGEFRPGREPGARGDSERGAEGPRPAPMRRPSPDDLDELALPVQTPSE